MSAHISCLEGGQSTTHGNGLVCASKCFRWPSGKAVWLWYSLTMTQHCVSERHNDGCLQVALTTRLHCTTHHRYMDEGLCLLTCKEIGLFLKSMSQKNFSSFGQYFRRLATLNFNHMTGVPQPHALFTSDQVSLYQLSTNWGREVRKGREDSHTLAHTRWIYVLLPWQVWGAVRLKIHFFSYIYKTWHYFINHNENL